MFNLKQSYTDQGMGHCNLSGHHGLYCGTNCPFFEHCQVKPGKANTKAINTQNTKEYTNKTAIVKSANGTVVEIPLVDSRDYQLVKDIAVVFDNNESKKEEVINDFTTPVVEEKTKHYEAPAKKNKSSKSSSNKTSQEPMEEKEDTLEKEAQYVGGELSVVTPNEQSEIDKKEGCETLSDEEKELGYVSDEDQDQDKPSAIAFSVELTTEDLAIYGTTKKESEDMESKDSGKLTSNFSTKKSRFEYTKKGKKASNNKSYKKTPFSMESNENLNKK